MADVDEANDIIVAQKKILLFPNTRLDNLTEDELSQNRLDSHWPLGLDKSKLLFNGWPQVSFL